MLFLSAAASCLRGFFRFLSFSAVGWPLVRSLLLSVARPPPRVLFVLSGRFFVLVCVAFCVWFLFLCVGLSLLRPPRPVSFVSSPSSSCVVPAALLALLSSPGARVGVVGSRSFPAVSLVSGLVSCLPAGVVVVSGCARRCPVRGFVGGGVVDVAACSAAWSLGLAVSLFPAAWSRLGPAAGPVRGRALARSGLAALCVFLSSPGAPSPGSSAALSAALSAGVPVFVFGPGGFVSGLRQGCLF